MLSKFQPITQLPKVFMDSTCNANKLGINELRHFDVLTFWSNSNATYNLQF